MLMPRKQTPPQPPPRAIGVNLVLFFAVALAALVLLTHTLVDIKQIQAGVTDAVRPATDGIQANAALLPALARTGELTGQLASGSQAINESLAAVVSSTRHAGTRIASVRSDSLSIADSVAGIARSTSSTTRGVTDLAASVRTTDRSAAQIASALAGTSRAVANLPDEVAAAAATLRLLASVIPSITQQVSAITASLAEVNGHLVDVNANGAIRLTNLLQLSNLLGATIATGR